MLLASAGAGWWSWSSATQVAAAQSSASGPAGQRGGPGNPASGPRRPGGGPGPGARGARVQPVSVGEVTRQDLNVTINAIGAIAAANTAVVRAKIEGELKAIHFQEGKWVKAGALLAELDARAFEIAVKQIEGQLVRDQAQLQNARLDLQRFQDLLTKDGISKQQVDTQAALVRQLQGTAQTTQALLDNARLQLSYTRITAPISGRVGLKQVDLGNVVRPGDAQGLLTISQTQPVNVVFAVPDAHLPRITSQVQSGATLPVDAWDRDLRKQLAVGKVSSTDNAIDASTGTIKLKASFANLDNGLFPNQAVQVRLQLAREKDVLTVPVNAVQRGSRGAFVYVLKSDQHVALQAVQAGTADAGRISVRGELTPGDLVVTDGAERLRDGAKVDVIAPDAAGQGGPASGPARGQGQRRRNGSAPA